MCLYLIKYWIVILYLFIKVWVVFQILCCATLIPPCESVSFGIRAVATHPFFRLNEFLFVRSCISFSYFDAQEIGFFSVASFFLAFGAIIITDRKQNRENGFFVNRMARALTFLLATEAAKLFYCEPLPSIVDEPACPAFLGFAQPTRICRPSSSVQLQSSQPHLRLAL